jgi:hypothetical protein
MANQMRELTRQQKVDIARSIIQGILAKGTYDTTTIVSKTMEYTKQLVAALEEE